jgi:hypothetical protein
MHTFLFFYRIDPMADRYGDSKHQNPIFPRINAFFCGYFAVIVCGCRALRKWEYLYIAIVIFFFVCAARCIADLRIAI